MTLTDRAPAERSVRPVFTPKTFSFLRSLKRNNDREWFRQRREAYERHVRDPMLAVLEQLGHDFRTIAPELETSPKKCLYRIYRDTRFSGDKTPLKTHIAASFRWRGQPRGEGPGLYFEVAPGWVWVGGGFYSPESTHLLRIREHISRTHPELHRIAQARTFRTAVGALDGELLTRVPRGFRKDDPAADYLKRRNFLAGREFPPALALTPSFYPTLLRTFRAILPMIRFLNEALQPVEDAGDARRTTASMAHASLLAVTTYSRMRA